MAPTKTVTIYRDRNGTVEKEIVHDTPPPLLSIWDKGVNFHQRTINTYYELEREGKLGDMSPREKKSVRDLHTYAQIPEYWPDGE